MQQLIKQLTIVIHSSTPGQLYKPGIEMEQI